MFSSMPILIRGVARPHPTSTAMCAVQSCPDASDGTTESMGDGQKPNLQITMPQGEDGGDTTLHFVMT